MAVKTKAVPTTSATSFSIATQASFSKDGKHRFLLSYEWDKKAPRALVITNYPGISDGLCSDLTTSLIINNCVEQGFGSVKLVNLFSLIGGLARDSQYSDGFTAVTDQVTLVEAGKADVVIMATGSFGTGNKYGKQRQEELLKALKTAEMMAKVEWLVNEQGKPAHPISTRANWQLSSIM